MNYDYLHEMEQVQFRSTRRRPLSELLSVFEPQGFSLHGDIFSLDRPGKIPPWQHSSIAEVYTECSKLEVFGFDEGEWDTVILKYLFASLPFEYVRQFARVVETTAAHLGLTPEFRGTPVSAAELLVRFEQFKQEILCETGEEPGTESLAILIQSTYPRK